MGCDLDASINRGLVCAHMHSISWTQKILIFMFWVSECHEQICTKYTPSTKAEYNYLYG